MIKYAVYLSIKNLTQVSKKTSCVLKINDEGKDCVVKKYLSRAVRLIIFVVILCVLYAGFDYMISDDTAAQTRVTFHDYYKAGKIDYLFIGPSHSSHEINAVQLSEDLGKNVFNLSTVDQDFIGTYYIIKEAAKLKKTDHIFLELSVSRLTIKAADETAVYIITDYMKSPLIKVKYLLSSFDMEGYINAFLRLRRNIDPQKLPKADKLTKINRAKSDPAYSGYAGTEKYMGKGQWAAWSSWANEDTGTAALNLNMRGLNNFTVDAIQERELEHLYKIIKLCKDEGIDLTFIIPPYSELYLYRFEKYDEVTQKFYDAAEENGIPVVDFNRVKEEYLDLKLADFYNSDHVNSDASPRIADFLAQYIRDPEGDYFYDSVEDKYPMNDDIIAVGYNRFLVTDEGEYTKKDSVEGTINSLRLEISAFSRVKRPVNVRMCVTEQTEDEEPVWIDGAEVKGEKLDEYTTQFTVPYNDLKTDYRVALLDPKTNKVLYEAVTRFNTD